MILAAGRGERMRPLTDELPKPLLRVGGRPLIEYHIEALARAGIRELVVNLSWHGDRLRAHLGDGGRFGVTIAYSEEGPVPLETGGGIRQALPLLGDAPFWVVNGDIYCEYPLARLALRSGALAHLVLVPNPAHHPAGDFALRDGLVRDDTTPRLTFTGLSVMDPGLFAGREPGRFALAPLLRAAAARGQVTGEAWPGRWADVGTPARLRDLDAALSAG